MPPDAKAWCNNPSEFVPYVHNHLGTMFLHTVWTTWKFHTVVATSKHRVGLQDGVQSHAHLLVVQPYPVHIWEVEFAYRLQLCPFLLPEIRRLEFRFVTDCWQNPKSAEDPQTVPILRHNQFSKVHFNVIIKYTYWVLIHNTTQLVHMYTHEHYPTSKENINVKLTTAI
jgi:hypothetical protein